MRRLPPALGLAVAAIALCTAAPALGADPLADPFAARPDSSPFAIRELLLAGETAELERRLDLWRASRDEQRLWNAHWTLGNLPRAESKALEHWLRSSPGSPNAHLAVALRELERAWEARGSGYASKVSEEAWREMRAHCARVLGLTEALLRLDPARIEAYPLRMEVGQLTGDRALVQASFEAALALDPTDYDVWSERLSIASRRWGGSYEEQAQLAMAAQGYADANPRLRKLRARPFADRALDLVSAKRYDEALELLDLALELGEHSWMYRRRGRLHARAGDHSQALADFDRAIAIGGPQPKTHYSRSFALYNLDRHHEGLAALELAVALEPGNRQYRKRLAEIQNWLAARERWANPSLPDAFEYAMYLLLEHALLGLACVLGVWALWRGWLWRRGPRPGQAPLVVSAGLGPHPELPAMVALLLRSVLALIVLVHVWVFVGGWGEGDRVLWYLDLPISVVALAGALAYARGRRLGTQELWRLWAVLYPSWNLICSLWIEPLAPHEWGVFAFFNLALLPVYASLFAYGFGSRSIWADSSSLTGAPWETPVWDSSMRRSPDR